MTVVFHKKNVCINDTDTAVCQQLLIVNYCSVLTLTTPMRHNSSTFHGQ